MLLQPNAGHVNPALNSFHLRPGLGISFTTTRWLSIDANGCFGWSPSPASLFVEKSIAQAETSAGFIFGID